MDVDFRQLCSQDPNPTQMFKEQQQSTRTGTSKMINPPSASTLPARRTTMEFPACACDCLRQVDKNLRYDRNVRPVRELQNIIDQDLFCLGPDRRATRLSPIQELKLLDVLCSFFQEKSVLEPRLRYPFFEIIFCGREGESIRHEARINVLVRLCSLAVQYRCDSLISDVTTWLNKVGLAKAYARQIVSRLVEDFCSQDQTPQNDKQLDSFLPYMYLQPLITSAPEITPYFLAISLNQYEMYHPPPSGLLHLIADWLLSNPLPLIRPFKDVAKQPMMSALTKMLGGQAVPKLVALTCLAPLSETSLITVEESSTDKIDMENLHAKLHTGILHLLLAVPSLNPPEPCRLLSDQQTAEILSRIRDLQIQAAPSQLDMVLDRTSQVLQVALVSRCFHGNKDLVKKEFEKLAVKHELFEFIFNSPL